MGTRRVPSSVKLADFPGRARCNGVPGFFRGEKKINFGNALKRKRRRRRRKKKKKRKKDGGGGGGVGAC